MAFKLPDLPYAYDALEPHVSAETLHFHHDKHHKTYLEKLNDAVKGTPLADRTLEEVIVEVADDPERKSLFNNAAQSWSHSFYWRCMSPSGGGEPEGELARQIERDFGSFDKLRESFIDAAAGQFGSGWAWLVRDAGRLEVIATPNAVLPMVQGGQALLACDVWEHAYYLDYQNERPTYLEAFFDKLVDWRFVAEQFALQGEGDHTAARRFREEQEAFASDSGRVAEAAGAAKRAVEGPEADELERARRRSARTGA